MNQISDKQRLAQVSEQLKTLTSLVTQMRDAEVAREMALVDKRQMEIRENKLKKAKHIKEKRADEAMNDMIAQFHNTYGIIMPDKNHPRIAMFEGKQYIDMRHMKALDIKQWVMDMTPSQYRAFKGMNYVLPDFMQTKEDMIAAVSTERAERAASKRSFKTYDDPILAWFDKTIRNVNARLNS